MNKQVEIIDNFLNKENFQFIQALLLGDGTFPWYYNHGTVYDNETDHVNNYQFTHNFYSDHCPRSDYFNAIFPVIEIIKPISILRIKSNLLTRTETHVKHGFHIDVSETELLKESKTGILYLNSNNGYTLFENGEIVESVENRFAIFNSKLMHTGTTCTDEKVRVVINFNYISN